MNDSIISAPSIAPPLTSDKHEQLDRSICELSELSASLSNLLERVTGHTSPSEPSAPQPARVPPSLCEVLSEGPSRIRKQIDEMLSTINGLTDELF
jgi:hypothetical protein